MPDRKIAVVVGSLRKGSYNRKMALALEKLAPPSLKLGIVEIRDLALYDEDLEATPPQAWLDFRAAIRGADAVMFVTPEYNRSVPGGLKNAIDVGSRPYGLAVADLTGDGIPDIVTANYRSANISVLMGDGHGNFGPPLLLPVGLAPNEVQVADLNGDGIPDLVTANFINNTLSVLLGNGDGSFQDRRDVATGLPALSVAAADVNGDGRLDLIVGGGPYGSV